MAWSLCYSSDIIEDLLNDKQIGLIGAVYDIASGKVRFLDDTLML